MNNMGMDEQNMGMIGNPGMDKAMGWADALLSGPKKKRSKSAPRVIR
jgi:hypothetical protein